MAESVSHWAADRTRGDMTSEEWEWYERVLHWLDKPEQLKAAAQDHFKRFGDTQDGEDLLGCQQLLLCVASLHECVGLPPPFAGAVKEFLQAHDEDRDGLLCFEEFFGAFQRLLTRVRDSIRIVGKAQLLPKTHQAFLQKYKMVRQLAAGAQGYVYLAEEKASKRQVAVKVPRQTLCTLDFDNCRDFSHPNIVRVFECFADRQCGKAFVVMEYCPGGTLIDAIADMVQRYDTLDDFWVAGVFKQCLLGVLYIHHQFGVAHNDLKPENILLANKGTSRDDVPRCMVADFGCAAPFLGEAGGDPRYKAPERFETRTDNPLWKGAGSSASDAWACGVILFEMLSGGLLPFINRQNIAGLVAFRDYQGGALMDRLYAGIINLLEKPNFDLLHTEDIDAMNLAMGLLRKKTDERLCLKEACDSPWFTRVVQPGCVDGSSVAGWIGAKRSRGVGCQSLAGAAVHGLRTRAFAGVLRSAVLTLVASRLQGEQLNPYYDLFARYDTSNNGTIGQSEFIKLCADEGIDEQEATDLFLMADADGDGKFDFTEFIGALFDPSLLPEKELLALFRATFAALADNSSKRVPFSKFKGLFDTSMSRDVISGLFACMDKDGDGTISWVDFCSFLLGGDGACSDWQEGFADLALEAGPLVRGITRVPGVADPTSPPSLQREISGTPVAPLLLRAVSNSRSVSPSRIRGRGLGGSNDYGSSGGAGSDSNAGPPPLGPLLRNLSRPLHEKRADNNDRDGGLDGASYSGLGLDVGASLIRSLSRCSDDTGRNHRIDSVLVTNVDGDSSTSASGAGSTKAEVSRDNASSASGSVCANATSSLASSAGVDSINICGGSSSRAGNVGNPGSASSSGSANNRGGSSSTREVIPMPEFVGMSLGALKKQARAEGIGQEAVDAADGDVHPAGAVIQLILENRKVSPLPATSVSSCTISASGSGSAPDASGSSDGISDGRESSVMKRW